MATCRLLLHLLLFCTACVIHGKICDKVQVNGRTMCAPALFVPGLGKCGTNALKTYTDHHPRLLWSHDSEVLFDPKTISAVELSKQHNPGVTPEDNRLWAVKAPALGNRVRVRSRHTDALLFQ